MILDKFTKVSLVLMVVIVLAIIILAYIGSEYEMKGSDEIVSEIITEQTDKEPISVVPTISNLIGEEITYTIVGIIAGFIVGYFWTDLFNNKDKRDKIKE